MPHNRKDSVIVSFLFCFFLCSNLWAEQQGSFDVDSKAVQVMKQMSQYMNTLNNFTIHVESTEDKLTTAGRKIQYGSSVDVYVKRPDKLRADRKSDDQSQYFYYDGETLTLFNHTAGMYSSVKTPPTLEAALFLARNSYGIHIPASDIIEKNVYESLVENITYGEYLGLHRVGNIKCHHLLFSQDEVDWQIWIEDSTTPLPRKLIITERLITGGPQFTAVFSKWDLSPDLPDTLFKFTPPENAEAIDFLLISREEGN